MSSTTTAPPQPPAWDGYGPYPARAAEDAHHILSEWHAYAAIAGVSGARAAEDETRAPLAEHAARLAAALGELLAESAALRVLAAGSEVTR